MLLSSSPHTGRRSTASVSKGIVNDSSCVNITIDEGRLDVDNEKDVFWAKLYFSLVGIGYLFPFSALTQPVDYWNMLFPDFNIEFQITCLYMYTNLAMLGALVFLSTSKSRQFTPRIVGGFIGQLIVLVLVPTSYFFITRESVNEIVVLSATAAAAIVTAFLDSSVIALAAQYPLRIQEAFQLGIGISTLIGSLYRILTKLAFPPELLVESSLLYFYSGAMTILGCIGAYYGLLALPMSKKILSTPLTSPLSSTSSSSPSPLTGPYPVPRSSHPKSSSASASASGGDSGGNSVTVQDETTRLLKGIRKERTVLEKIWYNELLVSCHFILTLALWPPLVTEIKSFQYPTLQATGWYPLLLLGLFSLCDCGGRLMVSYRWILTRFNLWKAVASRLLLVPLLLCSVKGILFTHDAWSCLFVAALGYTNGYLGTLAIIFVNECELDNQDDIATAGTYTSFFLNAGLVIGATLGTVMEYTFLN